MFSVKHVTPDVALQELGHKTVHGSAHSAHELQDVRAIAFLIERTHQRLDLPLNALGPKNQVLLLVDGMTHVKINYTIPGMVLSTTRLQY